MLLVFLFFPYNYLLARKFSDYLDSEGAGLSYPCFSYYNIESLTSNALLVGLLFVDEIYTLGPFMHKIYVVTP